MASKLILIRHGETEWNARKRYSGSNDIRLNARGRGQARKLRERLRRESVDKIYSSPRVRAIETARIAFGKRDVEIMHGLEEIDFGVFEGLTYSEAMKRYPKVYAKWLKDPFNARIPGGETLKRFKKRVVGAMKKIILTNKRETVAVVCHGGSIGAYLAHVTGSKDFWKLVPKSTAVAVVEFIKGRPVVRLLNCTKHLKKNLSDRGGRTG